MKKSFVFSAVQRAASATAAASPPASRAATAALTASPVAWETSLVSMIVVGTSVSSSAMFADWFVPDNAEVSVTHTMASAPASATSRYARAKSAGVGWEVVGISGAVLCFS
jgi:hypothetical protein